MPAIETYVPSHPGLSEVDFKEEYCSALIARKVRLSDTMVQAKPIPQCVGLSGWGGHGLLDGHNGRTQILRHVAIDVV